MVTDAFFNDFGDLLERTSLFTSPQTIVRDFNSHMGDANTAEYSELVEVPAMHDLIQRVSSSTRIRGKILDLVTSVTGHASFHAADRPTVIV